MEQSSWKVIILVKKFPAFYKKLKVYYHVHKSLPLDPILSQINPLHTHSHPFTEDLF
jgi:hypothetical protein